MPVTHSAFGKKREILCPSIKDAELVSVATLDHLWSEIFSDKNKNSFLKRYSTAYITLRCVFCSFM
jgi:hypothetical protein